MISASQAAKARDCLRLWAFDWQDPEPYKGGPEAELGKAVHAVAEDYHVRGMAPDSSTDAGRIFLPALPFLPRPFVGRAEGEFVATISGVDYRGFVDLQCFAGEVPGHAHFTTIPAVLDYKTIKDLTAKRMLDGPGEFLDDPQALLYALKALIQHKAEQVLLRWVYLRRGEYDAQGKLHVRPKAIARDALLTRAQVVDAFARIVHPLADTLVQLKKTRPDPLTLPPSPARCLKYGPRYACRHISKCNLSPADKLGSFMEDDMDLLEQLKAKMAQEPAKTVNAPEAKGPVAVASTGTNTPKAAPMNEAAQEHKKRDPGPTNEEIANAVRVLFRAMRG